MMHGSPWLAVLALALAGCSSSSATPADSGSSPDGNSPIVVDGGHHSSASSSTLVDAGGAKDGTRPDTSTVRDAPMAMDADGGATADVVTPADAPPGSDGSIPATCPATFTLPDSGYSSVNLETDFDMWSTAIPMTESASGVWEVTTAVPYGTDVQYKFVADGNWIVNPSQPTVFLPTISAGANTNNLLQAVRCGGVAAGTLALVGGAVTTTASSYSFQVKWTAGGAPLDTQKTVITLNGASVAASAAPYDATTGIFTVSVTSGVTSPNKYGYVFQVEDTAGNPARLFVPFWVGSSDWEWDDSFMYEVMIDRFLPGGTSKMGPNGPPTVAQGDWMGGDFGGVTQKINAGYFDAMGVNTLWLSSPVLGTKLCEEGTGANTGYCLSGYHSYFPIASGWTYGSESDPLFTGNGITQPIDPHFGVAADLNALVNAAHQHGMRVLTDLVVNHVFADSSPPVGQAPQLGPLAVAHQLDLAWFNTPYNSGVDDCGNENLWDTPESSTWNRADCWFDPYLPDLNSTDLTADDAITNGAVWLMEQFNLDGFRVDAVKQVNSTLCSDMRSKLDAAISTGVPFYMVGEALGSIVGNVMDCVAPTMLNGSVDDNLHNAIVGTVLQTDGTAGYDLDGALEYDEATWTGVQPTALMGHFFGSHDTPRAISLAEGDSNGDPWSGAPPAQETNPAAFQHLSLAQALLLTYDSIPILWMGDEFGQPGTIDPDCRRMMRFGSALSSLETQTLTGLETLGVTRLAHSALRRGTRTRLYVLNQFYAYGRVDSTDGDIVVAAFNFGTTSETETMSVTNIGLTGTVTDVLSHTSATVSGGMLTLTVPPLTAAVYVQ